MELILDALFHSIYTILAIWLVLQSLGYLVLEYWQTFYHKKLRNFIVIFLPLILFLVMFIFYQIGKYGYIEKITEIEIVDGKICILDEKTRQTKWEGEYKVCRLYMLNLDNGQEISRVMIGSNAKILKIIDNNIIFNTKWLIKKRTIEMNELRMYDVKTNLLTDDSLNIANFIQSNSNVSKTKEPNFELVISASDLIYTDTILNINWKTKLAENKLLKTNLIENEIIYKEKLIFSIGTYLYCINATNGNIIWEKEY